MPILHAIILGIAQGLTEYMPVSSSGHLILIPWLLGWNDFAGDPSLKKAFDVAVHLGTLVGAVAYLRHDIVRYTRAAARSRGSRDGRIGWLILLSAVPAGVTGALLAGPIERSTDEIWLVAVMLIVGALALGWADGALGRRRVEEIRLRDALVVGTGQALALQPGLSRAGVTITLGRFVGLARDAAARFAFLMSVPIIAGALVYKAIDVQLEGGVPGDMVAPFLCGIVSSAVTGYLSVWGTLRIVSTRSFLPFVVYRLLLGTTVLVLLAAGFR